MIKTIITKLIRLEILSVTLVAVADGGDNIGVYIPLFTGYPISQIIITILIFALMMALWCFLGSKIINLQGIKTVIERYKHIAVPVLFICLGIYIVIKSGLFNAV